MSWFGVAPGRCLLQGCMAPQAFERRRHVDATLPLCFTHRTAFQRSTVYLAWRRSKDRDLTGRAASILVEWVESFSQGEPA